MKGLIAAVIVAVSIFGAHNTNSKPAVQPEILATGFLVVTNLEV